MNTYCIEFTFNKEILRDSELLQELVNSIVENIEKTFGSCPLAYQENANASSKGFMFLYRNVSNYSILMQGSINGLLTIDIHCPMAKSNLDITGNSIDKLRMEIYELENIFKHKTLMFKSLPPIKRGLEFSVYDQTSSGLLLEYDFDQVVFDQDSQYQNVRILHSEAFGNCLFLDNDLNLAESDLAYTKAITGGDAESYRGKNVLILGGGDGGILNYLVDKGPEMVTLIDIDRVVVDAAKIHLRGICGDSMDREQGKNYKIIIGDCIKYLEEYATELKQFDIIINDLTAIPISKSPIGSHWDFMRYILKLSFQVLKKNGKYYTQGNGSKMVNALAMYEKQLRLLSPKFEFTKEEISVPSYMEQWMFYTIWQT